jgi:hypothetical protein
MCVGPLETTSGSARACVHEQRLDQTIVRSREPSFLSLSPIFPIVKMFKPKRSSTPGLTLACQILELIGSSNRPAQRTRRQELRAVTKSMAISACVFCCLRVVGRNTGLRCNILCNGSGRREMQCNRVQPTAPHGENPSRSRRHHVMLCPRR